MDAKTLFWREGKGCKKHLIEQVAFVWQEGEGGKKHHTKTERIIDTHYHCNFSQENRTTDIPQIFPQEICFTTQPTTYMHDLHLNMICFLMYAFVTYIIYELYVYIKSIIKEIVLLVLSVTVLYFMYIKYDYILYIMHYVYICCY
jgi:hypothetical protein